MKACSKCGESMPLSDFYKSPNARDGRFAACKTCVLRERRERYEVDGETLRARQRAYRAAKVPVRSEPAGRRPAKDAICVGCGGVMWTDHRRKTNVCRACGPKSVSSNPRYARSRRSLESAIVRGDNSAIIAAAEACSAVDTQTGCWVWSGYKVKGYPILRGAEIGRVRVHRAVLEAKLGGAIGSDPAHHKCANRSCINPDHLQAVTQAENTAEMMQRRAYEARIAELEVALASIAPDHPALNALRVAS